MPKLILLRHGESQWNLENRFTGWVDVPLTPRGEEEARVAPGGRVVEARQQSPELAVGGVAGGLAPLQELLDDAAVVIRLHAHAAHPIPI